MRLQTLMLMTRKVNRSVSACQSCILIYLERSGLTTLPSELHLKIFDLFDDEPETSTCLGLTCKKLYPLFIARHPKPKLFRMCPKCESLKRKAFVDKDSKNLYTNCESCKNIDTSGSQLFVLLEEWMTPKWVFSAYQTTFLTSRKAVAIQRGICDNFAIAGESACSAWGLMKFEGYGCSSCTVNLENKFLGAVWVRAYEPRGGSTAGRRYGLGGMGSRGRRLHGQGRTSAQAGQHQYKFVSESLLGRTLYK
jgi:hypothetical protein